MYHGRKDDYDPGSLQSSLRLSLPSMCFVWNWYAALRALIKCARKAKPRIEIANLEWTFRKQRRTVGETESQFLDDRKQANKRIRNPCMKPRGFPISISIAMWACTPRWFIKNTNIYHRVYFRALAKALLKFTAFNCACVNAIFVAETYL